MNTTDDEPTLLRTRIGWICLVGFVSILLMRAGWVVFTSGDAVVDGFADDAYYYFGIARNVWHRGMVSFDGLESTSGFHPLWLANLLPIFGMDLGRVGALRAVRVYTLVLYALTVVIAGRYLFAHYGILGATASLCFGVGVANDVFGAGMETSLALVLAVAALVQAERCVGAELPREFDGRFLVLGLLLGLLQLARLDAVWLVGTTVATSCVVHWWGEGTTRRQVGAVFLRVAGPSASLGVVYLAVNIWSTGTPIPMSAQVKSMGNPVLNWRFLDQLAHHPAWTPFAIMTVGSLFWLIWALVSERGGRWGVHPRDAVGAAVGAFLLIFTGMNLVTSTWSLWIWYQYPLVLFAFFTLPRVVESASALELPEKWRAAAALGLFVVTVVFVPVAQVAEAPERPAESFRLLNRSLADEMNARLPADTTVAMGERAGSFGYFFEGHVVHMEGLVGTQETLRALRTDAMSQFLDRKGVDFLVDYGRLPEQYGEATIALPNRALHLGPQVHLRVCPEREWYRTSLKGARVPDATLRVWRWPAC